MENEKPLAFRMRPRSLGEFVGQEHLVGAGKPLRVMIEKKIIPQSIIFWGPPGCGKTTLAKLLSTLTGKEFLEYSAVSAGKEEIKTAIQRARLFHKRIVVFLDEIHRFNKAQQDFLLPYVEDGTITLIGATIENPSFEVISALLSRSTVFVLNRLNNNEIVKIIDNALIDERGFSGKVFISDENKKLISELANGDARAALNILENAYLLVEKGNNRIEFSKELIINAAQKRLLIYDKEGEEHYNIISALHKSMRDSDADAAVYWTMRMIESGEDPNYIIRRMIRFASEDIGNADPNALKIAVAAKDAVNFLGYPECDVVLVQTAIYLAKAPKSNSTYKAVLKVREDMKKTGNLQVPFHLRNPVTKLMEEMGYGKGYKYAHDYKDKKVNNKNLPEELSDKKYVEE